MATSSYRARELEQLRQELRRELRMHDDAEEDAVMGTPPRATARRPMSSSARVGRSSGFGDGARAAASARARAAASGRETRFDHPPPSRLGGGPVTPIAERARRPATARAPSSVSRDRRDVHDRAPRAARTPRRTPRREPPLAPPPSSASPASIAPPARSRRPSRARLARDQTPPSQRGPRYDLNGRRVDAFETTARRRDGQTHPPPYDPFANHPPVRADATTREACGRDRPPPPSNTTSMVDASEDPEIETDPATAAATTAEKTRRLGSSSAWKTRAPVPLNERPAFDAGPGGLGVDNRDPRAVGVASRRRGTATVSPPVARGDRTRARTSETTSKMARNRNRPNTRTRPRIAGEDESRTRNARM